MSRAVVSMSENYPDSLVDPIASLRLSFQHAIPGMQLLQHCEVTVGGSFPADHGLAGHDYQINPFYPSKTDETGSGWAAAKIEIDSSYPQSRVLSATIMGVPSIKGPDVKMTGKVLPVDAEMRIAAVLGVFATGIEGLLEGDPSIVETLGHLNSGRLFGRERKLAIRHLKRLVRDHIS